MLAGGGEAAERIAIVCLADGFTVAALYEQAIAPAMARYRGTLGAGRDHDRRL